MQNTPEVIDVIQYASQIGRLDFISALLACIAVIIVFSGIVAYINIRGLAKQIAATTAEKIAKEEAEKHANIYLQENLPELISSYDDLIRNQVAESVANNIAEAQEESK